MHCPVCGSQKFKTYVNPVTGFWYCHAPEHSGGGRIDTGMPLHDRASALRQMKSKHERPRWHEMSLPEWQPLGWRAKRYLQQRGIDEDMAARLGIVEMADRMRVVVPYYGPDGGIIYWNARSYTDLEEGPKYLAASGKHPLYVLPHWEPQEEVIVVEGVFDAIAAREATGYSVLALGGKALPRYLLPDLLDLVGERIVLCLDSGAEDAALKLKKQLMFKRKVRIVPMPVGEDPASLGPKLKEII